ncbi:Epsin-3, clathrin recruitment and traffic between the Golgi and endosome, partial [Coemansia spiralis]
LTDISVWDVRNVYNKVKNVVMNYSEMEAKVNEATGPEPWGASSTLMRELADATHHRKEFDDIMAMVYLRLSDTDPANWRQVYKALQLLEYLIKNGASRVADDVRGHIVVKTLKSFHHIDASGKDQGINVRHRSKEILDLINDPDRLREERNKAKDNRNKYGGFSGGGRMDGFGNTASSSSRGVGRTMSGFGNSAMGGLSSSDYQSSRYDDRIDNNYRSETDSTPSATTTTGLGSRRSTRQITPVGTKAKVPEVADLFSFDDDFGSGSSGSGAARTAQPAGNIMDSLVLPAHPAPAAKSTQPVADDDWGDFQAADSGPSTQLLSSTPATVPAPAGNTYSAPFDLLSGDDAGVSFQPLVVSPAATRTTAAAATPTTTATTATATKAAAFSDIWDMRADLMSLDSLSLASNNASGSGKAAQRQQGASLNQLASQNN